MGAIVRNLGREHGIDARLAFDSDRLRLVASTAEKAQGPLERIRKIESVKTCLSFTA
jgi:hypothetical protein